jgi:hypothetical protein
VKMPLSTRCHGHWTDQDESFQAMVEWRTSIGAGRCFVNRAGELETTSAKI